MRGQRNWTASRQSRSGKEKEEAWRLMTDETTGPETVSAAAAGFMQPEHADVLAPYAARYLAEIPDLWRTRSGHMRMRLANVLFPYPAVTPEFLTRIEEILAATEPTRASPGSSATTATQPRAHCVLAR
jgi:aminopeptidase N